MPLEDMAPRIVSGKTRGISTVVRTEDRMRPGCLREQAPESGRPSRIEEQGRGGMGLLVVQGFPEKAERNPCSGMSG